MTDRETMGDRVKRFRETKSWSVNDLAKQSQVSASQINRLERGVTPGEQMTVAVIGKLADALGVSVNVLRGVEDPVPEDVVPLVGTTSQTLY